MLTGKELGKAIALAIDAKIAAGAIRSKAEVAHHFGIKTPSIYDWIKKGSISKDKLPELWRFFSDVVGPTHWGLSAWPTTFPPSKSKTCDTSFWPFHTPFSAYQALSEEKKQRLDERVADFIAGATCVKNSRVRNRAA
jgi:hypothetical protein